MPQLPLRLTLEPQTPSRTPSRDGTFANVASLRLPGGPLVRTNDPLLAAYGATVIAIDPADDEESLQGAEFDPGRRVRLEREIGPSYEPAIGVWDAEGVRRAGTLRQDDPDTPIVVAAEECGLAPEGIVLIEHRTAAEDRRVVAVVFAYSPALVAVEIPANLPIERPTGVARRRIVLMADRGDVRFWDPAGRTGPIEPQELPISPQLAAELQTLRSEYRALASEGDGELGVERLERGWMREQLDQQSAALWRRVRDELGRRYAVGFLGPGMQRPVWSPSELARDGHGRDDGIPF